MRPGVSQKGHLGARVVRQDPQREMTHTIYTIGSSNRAWDEFLAVLLAYEIRAVVDVRAFPAGFKPNLDPSETQALPPQLRVMIDANLMYN